MTSIIGNQNLSNLFNGIIDLDNVTIKNSSNSISLNTDNILLNTLSITPTICSINNVWKFTNNIFSYNNILNFENINGSMNIKLNSNISISPTNINIQNSSIDISNSIIKINNQLLDITSLNNINDYIQTLNQMITGTYAYPSMINNQSILEQINNINANANSFQFDINYKLQLISSSINGNTIITSAIMPDLQAQIMNLDYKINNLNSSQNQIPGIINDINNINLNINTLSLKVSQNTSDVTTLKSQYNQLNNDFTLLNTQVNNNSSEITKINQKLLDNSNITTLPNIASIGSNSHSLNLLGTSILINGNPLFDSLPDILPNITSIGKPNNNLNLLGNVTINNEPVTTILPTSLPNVTSIGKIGYSLKLKGSVTINDKLVLTSITNTLPNVISIGTSNNNLNLLGNVTVNSQPITATIPTSLPDVTSIGTTNNNLDLLGNVTINGQPISSGGSGPIPTELPNVTSIGRSSANLNLFGNVYINGHLAINAITSNLPNVMSIGNNNNNLNLIGKNVTVNGQPISSGGSGSIPSTLPDVTQVGKTGANINMLGKFISISNTLDANNEEDCEMRLNSINMNGIATSANRATLISVNHHSFQNETNLVSINTIDCTTSQNINMTVINSKDASITRSTNCTMINAFNSKFRNDSSRSNVTIINGRFLEAHQQNDQLITGIYNNYTLPGFFVVGCGTTSNHDNCLRVTSTNVYGKSYSSSGADYAEYFETCTDTHTDFLFVTFDKGKYIRLTNITDNYILGIGSKYPVVVGNNPDKYHNIYKLDDELNKILVAPEKLAERLLKFKDTFKRMLNKEDRISEEYKQYSKLFDEAFEFLSFNDEDNIDKNEYISYIKSLPGIDVYEFNEHYSDQKTYTLRSERKEWKCIGLIGQLIVRDNGLCDGYTYCTNGDNGIAIPYIKDDIHKQKNMYYIMERINKNLIKIMFK